MERPKASSRCEMTINPAWAEHADRDVVIVISRPKRSLAAFNLNCNSFSFAMLRLMKNQLDATGAVDYAIIA
jgi:hypothetical protein